MMGKMRVGNRKTVLYHIQNDPPDPNQTSTNTTSV